MKRIFEALHERHGFQRRVRVLAQALAPLLPHGASVLDVGCGSGEIACAIMLARPDLQISGIDVLVRPETRIPVAQFDGSRIPAGDASVDVVLFVDVLHHTDCPSVLLREGARVARRAVVLKDHLADGFMARPTLRFMDEVGNRRHGVRLPFNYWTRAQWRDAFADIGLGVASWSESVPLYPFPANLVFTRKLHVVAALTNISRSAAAASAPGR